MTHNDVRTRRSRRWPAGIAAVLLAAGCGVVPGLPAGGPCPEGWRSAVLWSTQNGWSSQLAFVTEDGGIERQNLPYTGFWPAAPIERADGQVIMAADGNAGLERGRLVTISTADCTVAGPRIDETGVWSIESNRGDVYATNALNGEGVIRRRTPDGTVAAEVILADVLPTKLMVHGDRLYVLATGLEDDQTMMLTLDAKTLAEQARVEFPEEGSPLDAVIRDGRLYYPETIAGGAEGTRLRVVDLKTGRRSAVELGSPAPYLMAETDDHLYIGHTFMNPGFRPMAEYRRITRYDPTSGKVERFDVGAGIESIAIKDQRLYVLSPAEDQATATLRTFDLPAVTLRSEVVIPKPTGMGHYYTSAIVLP